MSHAAGADLPTEILSIIVNRVIPTDAYCLPDIASRRRAKQQLVWLSLVCKYWSEVISPLIFRELRLRDREDLMCLRRIMDGHRFRDPPLGDIVDVLDIHLDLPAQRMPWFGHLHWLSTKLPRTIIRCVVADGRDPAEDIIDASSSFRALPHLPPSYVRLTTLTLCGLAFASVAEVRRLISTFATLKSCHCERLMFDDPSSLLRPRRTQRQSRLPLDHFVVSQCAGAPLHALSTLAFGCVGRSAHWSLEDDTWANISEALTGLVALATQCFSHIAVRTYHWEDTTVHLMISTPPDANGFITDDMRIAVHICSPENEQPNAAPSPAFVQKIVITCRAVDPSAVISVPWDVLDPMIASPLFHTLRFEADRRDEGEYTTLRRILVTVLRGTHLHRALDSGKLRFGLVDDADEAAISRADILAVPATHTVYSTALTLDVEQQAEWLLCDGAYSRDEYLQMLRAELATDPPDYMVDASGDEDEGSLSAVMWTPNAHMSPIGRGRSRIRDRENWSSVVRTAAREGRPTSPASGTSSATSRSRAVSV